MNKNMIFAFPDSSMEDVEEFRNIYAKLAPHQFMICHKFKFERVYEDSTIVIINVYKKKWWKP